MYNIIQTIWSYVQLHHEAILAAAGPVGVGLSVAVQWFLHKFKIDGSKLSFMISHVFAMATAVSAYFLDSAHPNVGVTWGWIWIASQFWHRFAVNPAYNKYVLPFLAWLANPSRSATGVPAAQSTGPVAAPDSSLE